jgi:hypothetical protein
MTATAIAARCHDEELVTADRLFRIQSLEAQLDGCSLKGNEIQLACEAIKFHTIRLAGFDVHSALAKMGVA